MYVPRAAAQTIRRHGLIKPGGIFYMQTILSIVMAMVMTLNASLNILGVRDIFSQASAMQTSSADALLPEQVDAPAADTAATREGTDWADMEYEHYDPDSFYSKTDRLTDLAAGQDGEAVTKLYDELYEDFVRIDTLDSVAYIHYCDDVTDEYWSEERIYCDTLLAEAADALSTACAAVMAGPCADAFAAHVGDGAAAAFAEYAPMTDREAELVTREAELVDEYYTIMSSADQAAYSYLGETWTQEMLNGYQGANLANNDYDGYLEVFYGLQKAVNDQVAHVFTELVQLRAEIADINGYDNYADMAYEQVYGRDYTAADAQALCDAVKPVAQSYNADLYYSDLWYAAESIEPVMDAETQIETLGRAAGQIDPILTEPWQFMTDHGLCRLTDSANAFPGGYTITISGYDCPLIFNALEGDCYDFKTLTHEFGHFTNEYYAPLPNLLTAVGSYDLMEIHSTGLELLFTELYDDIFTQGADTARFLVLGAQMEQVIDGCIYDEFQRRVYADPDMTMDEMNRLFAQISSRYGQYEPYGVNYGWVYVAHTFESPLYYISYAASSLAAIQIWNMARQDFRSGVETWKAVLNADTYTDRYMTVLPACGLRVFTQENAVAEICAPLMEELTRLDGSRY